MELLPSLIMDTAPPTPLRKPLTLDEEVNLRALVAMLSTTREAPTALPGWVPEGAIRRHQLGPLVYTRGAPQFRKDYVNATLRGDLALALLEEADAALSAASARAIATGALAYGQRLYADPAQRPCEAIELLVHPADRRRAIDALLAIGYWRGRDGAGAECVLQRESAVVRLATRLVGGWQRWLTAAVWQRVRVAGTRLVLEPTDEALLALLGLAQRAFVVPLIYYVDVARLLEQDGVDHAALTERARELGVSRPAALAQRMLHGVIGRSTGPLPRQLGLSVSDLLNLHSGWLPPRLVRMVALAGGVRDAAPAWRTARQSVRSATHSPTPVQ